MQETDVKVDLFLETLNSLQDTLASSQNEDAPIAEPEVAADAAADEASGADQGHKADGTVDDGAGGKTWDDQPTYIEEEPWMGDIHPMWPNYSPGV